MTGRLNELLAKAEAAKELADKATDGPWESDVPGEAIESTVESRAPYDFSVAQCIYGKHDAEFIAAARTTVPELAQAIIELADENRRLRDAWADVAGLAIISRTMDRIAAKHGIES